MPAIGRTLKPRDRAAWRAFLEGPGRAAKEIWLLLAKKHVPGRWLSYEEAIEEALCQGWVDGIVKRFDEDFRAVRFSPRRKGSQWSELNKKRVARLLCQGRMTAAGMALVREAKRNGAWSAAARRVPDPDRWAGDVRAALAADDAARAFFEGLAPGYRKMALLWIDDARRPETRARRIAELVERSRRGERKF